MRKVIDWDGGWKFKKMPWADADRVGAMEQMEEVTLPHTWYVDGEYYQGDGVYQKVFAAEHISGRRYFLQFGGVDKISEIWLNGEMVGFHEGGYSMFAVELTDSLRAEGENVLTVLVNNETGDSVSPLSGDFTVFGGMSRSVHFLETNTVAFDPLYYGTGGVVFRTEMQENRAVVYAVPHVTGDAESTEISYVICDADGNEVCAERGAADSQTVICFDEPVLWNGKSNPYCYTVKAILQQNGQEIDSICKTIGFRSARMDADRGFFLNGEHLKLNGVAKHQDTAGVFSAATMEHWAKDMQLIYDMGANAVRFSHYQHPQAVYDICDEKGFVVWAEIPLLKLTNGSRLFENAKQQLTELILQNMHHPSICFWGLQNEIAIFGEQPHMPGKLQELQKLAKQLDPGRITTSANLNSVPVESDLNRITDVVAYNLYFGWYYGEMSDFEGFMDEFHRANPQIPVGISEYGCDCNLNYHSADPKVKDYTEEFQAQFHETVYPMLQKRDYIWGTFVWNMFDFVSGVRDEGGVRYRNNKGLVTHDRQTCKDSYFYYRAVWSDEPFVWIAEKRFAKRAQETMRIKVYSNQPEVTLISGGIMQTVCSETGVFCFDDVALTPGENLVEAKSGACRDAAVFLRVEKPEESYVFVDPNPGLNVKNWFVDEAEKEKIFPSDAYSIMDKIETLRDSEAAMEVIRRLQPKVADTIIDGIGTFTLEQEFVHSKSLCTEEEIKELNAALIQVKKQ